MVEARWRSESRGDEEAVIFDWKETGGPEVDLPQSEGVGSKLIQAISNRPEFSLERAFERDGLACRIEILLDRPPPS